MNLVTSVAADTDLLAGEETAAPPGRGVTESRSAGSSCGGGGGGTEDATSAAATPARQSHSLVTMETLTDELVANIMGEVRCDGPRGTGGQDVKSIVLCREENPLAIH